MKSKLKFTVFTLVVVLLFFIIVFEAGFRLRELLAPRPARLEPDRGRTRILFVGDSVMGVVEQKGSLAHAIAERLAREFPRRFQFLSLPPENRTTIAASKVLPDALDSFRPHSVIFLIGKSDHSYQAKKLFGVLSDLRFIRYLELTYHKVYHQFLYGGRLLLDLEEAWKQYGKKDCRKAIPLFEEALETIRNDRLIRALHDCFMETKNHQEAISSLSRFKNDSAYKNLVLDLITVHQFKLAQLHDEEVLGRLKATLKTRDYVRSNLWLLRELKRPELFKEEFLGLTPQMSGHPKEITRTNYQTMLEELEKRAILPVVLQYPLDHVGPLMSMVNGISSKAHVVDLRTPLEDLSPRELMEIWADDIEHLSIKGSEFFSGIVSDVVIKKLRTDL